MDAEAQLAEFVDRFAPDMQDRGSVHDLDRADVRALVDAALELAAVPMTSAEGPDLVIRSVSAKQRPRR